MRQNKALNLNALAANFTANSHFNAVGLWLYSPTINIGKIPYVFIWGTHVL